MWTSGCLLQLSYRKANLWLQPAECTHSPHLMVPQTYPSPPASRHLYMLSSCFLSTHSLLSSRISSPLTSTTHHHHHLTLRPWAPLSVCRLCHHNSRLLILAELSVLLRVTPSLFAVSLFLWLPFQTLTTLLRSLAPPTLLLTAICFIHFFMRKYKSFDSHWLKCTPNPNLTPSCVTSPGMSHLL